MEQPLKVEATWEQEDFFKSNYPKFYKTFI